MPQKLRIKLQLVRLSGRARMILTTIALLAMMTVCHAFVETPFSADQLMEVDTAELAFALERASGDEFAEQRPVPSVFCEIKVSRDKTQRNVPGCAMMSQIFSDIYKYGAQSSEFAKEPDSANLIIFTLSQKEMSEFTQKIRQRKIDLFSEFKNKPEYKVFAKKCFIVNFKTYPEKYLIVLPELIDEGAAYDCVTLGVLFYLAYPPSLLQEKYLPQQRSFYLTGIEYSVICMRNKGIPQFNGFKITSTKTEDWTWKQNGSAHYLGCQAN